MNPCYINSLNFFSAYISFLPERAYVNHSYLVKQIFRLSLFANHLALIAIDSVDKKFVQLAGHFDL